VSLKRLIDDVISDVGHRDNPFFRALVDGSFAREDFLETQYQFYSAVVFFSRPMAALAAKIPDAALRTEILRNVWEEHGEGDARRTHEATFVTLLSRLSALPVGEVHRELAKRPLWPEVRAFNTLLVGACVLDDYVIGAGTLGIVEHMFADISGLIGRALVARGFLEASAMVHYDLHETLDVRHARDFFAVLAAEWDKGPEERYRAEQGLRMGAMAFDQLFARLYRCRGRRWVR
jgi:hypothetical protein